MGDFAELRRKLLAGLSTLMLSESPQADALRAICSTIYSRGLKAALFGGVLRDLVVFGDRKGPRDFDIVVDMNEEDLFNLFRTKVRRRTRFGGLHILHEGWPLDIWPLERTWAFRHMAIAPTFKNLPRTTFLNVEAIAVDISNPACSEKALYEQGFFNAIALRTVEINLQENPYPALCVVRSLITACKLNFLVGENLLKYIRRVGYRTHPD